MPQTFRRHNAPVIFGVMSEEELKEAIMEYGGILPPHHAFYMEAIRPHCDSAMKSVDFLASFIKMSNETKGHYEQTPELERSILDHLENLISNAAAIRRYLWPIRDGKHNLHKERGRSLRSMFGIDCNSPLKDKKLRDFLEHFDEKLDNYLWERLVTGSVVPFYVGGVPDTRGVPFHVFRAYYFDIGVFESLGTRYEVQPIVNELAKIEKVLKGC